MLHCTDPSIFRELEGQLCPVDLDEDLSAIIVCMAGFRLWKYPVSMINGLGSNFDSNPFCTDGSFQGYFKLSVDGECLHQSCSFITFIA